MGEVAVNMDGAIKGSRECLAVAHHGFCAVILQKPDKVAANVLRGDAGDGELGIFPQPL